MKIIPLGRKLGAEVIGIDANKPITPRRSEQLREALQKYLVLLLKNQTLPVKEHVIFAQVFGDLGKIADTLLGLGKRKYPEDDIPDCVSVISNIKVNNESIGSLGDGECFWHSDSCFSDTPPSASTLYSVEIPDNGGNTAFLNMVDALETLPGDIRAQVDGLSIRHSQVYDSTGTKRPEFDEASDITKNPGPTHPIVRTLPEKNRQVLYLGRRLGAYIPGLTVKDSEDLLDVLWAHTIRECRTYSHRWSLGDLLVWDNRTTMHHRDSFDPSQRRRLHKVQVAGERPT